MKALHLSVLIFISALLSGCLYGQCIDGPCALERARMIRSIKAYGEYWVKPGMTKESWQQDWVACGGFSNGQYAGNAPIGSTTKVILDAQTYEKKRLDACMRAKGYEYHYTGPR